MTGLADVYRFNWRIQECLRPCILSCSQNQVRYVTHFTVYYIGNANRQFELYRRYLYAVWISCFIFISLSLNNSSEVHFTPSINFRVKSLRRVCLTLRKTGKFADHVVFMDRVSPNIFPIHWCLKIHVDSLILICPNIECIL